MGTPTQVCVWSCPNFSASAGRPFSSPMLHENAVGVTSPVLEMFPVPETPGNTPETNPEKRKRFTSTGNVLYNTGNTPDDFGSSDLWKLCGVYGTVVDVFIPNRMSKAGKRFAFVRFIRVVDMDRLIGNLYTLWVGRFHIHANAVRCKRPYKSNVFKKHPNPKGFSKEGTFVSVVKEPPPQFSQDDISSQSPALVLDDACGIERDLSRHVMGMVKDLSSILIIQSILHQEGFSEVSVSYLGGLWVLLELNTLETREKLLQHVGAKSWFHVLQSATHDFVSKERIVWVDIEGIPLHVWSRETFLKIGRKWGETMDIEESSISSFARKRLCIKTSMADNILESFKVIFKGKLYTVRAKELFAWTPQFQIYKPMDNLSDDVASIGNISPSSDKLLSDDELVDECDDDRVPVVGDKSPDVPNNIDEAEVQQSEDPFELYDLLNKPSDDKDAEPSLSHPPGFSPQVSNQTRNDLTSDNATNMAVHSNVMKHTQETLVSESSCDISSTRIANKMHKGGSILSVLDDMIRVGQSMGYDMILSLNIQGLGNKTKKEWVKELNNKHKINFLALQETKIDCISHMDVKFLWGNSNYQFVASDSIGNSGGILCIWEASIFKKDFATRSDNFIALYGTWLSNNAKVLIVVVYAPQPSVSKRSLWEYISGLISRWNGEVIVMGDFNEVRSEDERSGTLFNPSSARVFNNFISSSGLVEIKMEGYSFTWSHPSATKMSKLDRFLVSEGITMAFPSLTSVCLDRHLSDHRPILLKEIHSDFGPCPFRIYHSWFTREGFDDMVAQAWNSFSHSDSNKLIRFKKKLQALKAIIRGWIKDQHTSLTVSKHNIMEELATIDKTLDSGTVSDEILLKRMELTCNLNAIKLSESKDFAQKAKVKWAIEGDENSKFFHGLVNRKRAQLSIRGVFVDGDWQTDPKVVKDTFKEHFAARFQQPSEYRFKINTRFPKRLSSEQKADLDSNITKEEIRKAVWNCGANKSPGPDGFTLEFFKRYWSLVGSEFCDAVECFFDKGFLPKGNNASFIALIPKVLDAKFVNDFRPISLRKRILDGPFVVNELLAWCNRKKKQALMFKVDFAKAYDSVSSSMASILINGSPTSEFSLLCGLKQGDPLAPFLFILIMESFHNSVSKAVAEGFFRGLQIQDSVSISHLFYADDAFFIGEWSEENLLNLIKILKCFYLASGLKINLHKSQILGVGVHRDIVQQGASIIGCEVMCTPKVLWLLISSEKKITWIAWEKVLASKKHGGLGVAIIKAIYGPTLESHAVNFPSPWCSILREVKVLSSKGFNFLSHCKRRVGNGNTTRFWLDNWVLGDTLSERFPRLFALENNKQISIASKWGEPSLDSSFRRPIRGGVEQQQWSELLSFTGTISFSSLPDRWVCDLNGDGVFSVKHIRSRIDDLLFPSVGFETRWVKFIPIKGSLDSMLCPLCGSENEDSPHVFFRCELAKLISQYDDSSDEEFEIQRIWLCTFTDTEAARAAICFPNSHALSEVISSR
ncbi:RNA-directed DNA polymerase, eukaryota [Tanacetum coccineum]